MEWSTACPDWRRRIVAREPLIVCPPLFPSEADQAWEICSGFKVADLGGVAFGDVCLPWMEAFIRTVFGAYNPEDGRRYINEYLMMVSKKNAKSTCAAAIMLTALIMNWRPSAELLILSPTKEIADNSYKPIRDMIKADSKLWTPDDGGKMRVQDHFRTITHKETGASLKVVAADSDTVSGKKAAFVFIDELHEFGKQAKASNMLLEATGGLTSRPEGFVIYATTQSAEPPAGVFKEKLSYARRVRDGELKDKRFLPLIYEFPEDMLEAKAHEDLANAYVTNPNWGASVDIARIEQLHSQAKENGEAAFREFLAKHLNVEIGLNLRSDRWPGAEYWEKAALAKFTLDDLIARCEVAVIGIDGGGLDDLLGLAVIGRERGTGRWLLWNRAWAHKIVLDRRKEIAPRLLDFAAAGELAIVETPGPDVREVVDICERVREAGLLPDKQAIGVDAVGINAIVQELAERGFDVDPGGHVVAIGQSWRLNGAIKTAERMLAAGEMLHAGQLLMAWCVGNARVVVAKSGAVGIDKQASGTAKIDPLAATFNAGQLMGLNPISMVIGEDDDLLAA